ncbi:class I SAM-dependent methyltransferase [Undibacterium sp. Ji22W]|uniref:class I SAM-dependent methyltransferase n=1 Tax=Undibacterium sp. Ji22W TaxID=3413038 RepID=UPI003BF1AAE3
MKNWIYAVLMATVTAAALSSPVYAEDAALKAAVAAPTRNKDNATRDAARHPYETLSFFGIKPNMTVVELVPEGGWYTEILAPYLRANGTLIGAGDPLTEDQEGFYTRLFKKLLDSNPAVYDKVKMGVFQPSKKKFDFAKDGSIDMVLTFRNVHNWVSKGDEDVRAAFKAVFASLKSGGVFGVVDHRLPAGMRQAPDARGGYVHESYVIRLAEEAGFKLAAKSEVNANPKDLADYHNGVWSLPPSFANGDHNRARYAAIGESDRMTLKFVKP